MYRVVGVFKVVMTSAHRRSRSQANICGCLSFGAGIVAGEPRVVWIVRLELGRVWLGPRWYMLARM